MGAARDTVGSRGGAAVVVIALHAALLLLMMASLDLIVVPQFPNVAPIMARLIDEPRGQHLESDRPALRPRFLRPSVNLADVPPKRKG